MMDHVNKLLVIIFSYFFQEILIIFNIACSKYYIFFRKENKLFLFIQVLGHSEYKIFKIISYTFTHTYIIDDDVINVCFILFSEHLLVLQGFSKFLYAWMKGDVS